MRWISIIFSWPIFRVILLKDAVLRALHLLWCCETVRKAVYNPQFVDGPAIILWKRTRCFLHSSDNRNIHHTESVKTCQWVPPHSYSQSPVEDSWVIPTRGCEIVELCETYRWHSVLNEQIIAASLTKKFLDQF